MAERADEIDIARAEDEKRRAETQLCVPIVRRGSRAARISMLKALVRLRVATRLRNRV